MKYIVSSEWLLDHLQDRNVRIVDCRFSLSDSRFGRASYHNGHLPGAVFFDLEKDLSSPTGKHGGRHPLPSLDALVEKLEASGIDNNTIVVAYDQGDGAFAARFWWLLGYIGHQNVYVLDGGFQNWQAKKYEVTTVVPETVKSRFAVSIQHDWLSDINEVKAVVDRKRTDCVLIDSREEKRFLGIEELIDKKAGHIPGAVNKPWFKGLENGLYHSADVQKQRFAGIDPAKKVIVYCGSGITACPNFLALKEAGYPSVKLYAGSFSDWISYDDNKIEP
ncbi:sulfurtransferase [Neobacillus sp. SM06]|uniref:sulfurtransferase n=1 Tax=Neobacillus sp. SM06 TaxID=3422492 RepID=UPI003D276131